MCEDMYAVSALANERRNIPFEALETIFRYMNSSSWAKISVLWEGSFTDKHFRRFMKNHMDILSDDAKFEIVEAGFVQPMLASYLGTWGITIGNSDSLPGPVMKRLRHAFYMVRAWEEAEKENGNLHLAGLTREASKVLMIRFLKNNGAWLQSRRENNGMVLEGAEYQGHVVFRQIEQLFFQLDQFSSEYEALYQ